MLADQSPLFLAGWAVLGCGMAWLLAHGMRPWTTRYTQGKSRLDLLATGSGILSRPGVSGGLVCTIVRVGERSVMAVRSAVDDL